MREVMEIGALCAAESYQLSGNRVPVYVAETAAFKIWLFRCAAVATSSGSVGLSRSRGVHKATGRRVRNLLSSPQC